MQDCNVIAKGSYSQFRFNDFVSVRQYLLIRENGKKYLFKSNWRQVILAANILIGVYLFGEVCYNKINLKKRRVS